MNETYQCSVCRKVETLTVFTAYDDFYGDLCNDCWQRKVVRATHDPWTGKSR
jgi:hypothetical protein